MGEKDKISADYIKMAELKEDPLGGLLTRCEPEDLIQPKFEIIDL